MNWTGVCSDKQSLKYSVNSTLNLKWNNSQPSNKWTSAYRCKHYKVYKAMCSLCLNDIALHSKHITCFINKDYIRNHDSPPRLPLVYLVLHIYWKYRACLHSIMLKITSLTSVHKTNDISFIQVNYPKEVIWIKVYISYDICLGFISNWKAIFAKTRIEWNS